jgi:hypothetical protein
VNVDIRSFRRIDGKWVEWTKPGDHHVFLLIQDNGRKCWAKREPDGARFDAPTKAEVIEKALADFLQRYGEPKPIKDNLFYRALQLVFR